jgi:hypothetical protein
VSGAFVSPAEGINEIDSYVSVVEYLIRLLELRLLAKERLHLRLPNSLLLARERLTPVGATTETSFWHWVHCFRWPVDRVLRMQAAQEDHRAGRGAGDAVQHRNQHRARDPLTARTGPSRESRPAFIVFFGPTRITGALSSAAGTPGSSVTLVRRSWPARKRQSQNGLLGFPYFLPGLPAKVRRPQLNPLCCVAAGARTFCRRTILTPLLFLALDIGTCRSPSNTPLILTPAPGKETRAVSPRPKPQAGSRWFARS